MMPSVFLGIDGGNSRTIALIVVADGMVLRVGRSDFYGAISAEAATQELSE